MNIPDPVAVQVDSLRKQYGDVIAVDCVSFEVERGSVFGMIGPNGAGKTTTIECLEGLRRPDSGTVRVAGLDPWEDRNEVTHRIGVQLQEVGIPLRMKAREALQLFAVLYESSIPLPDLIGELGIEEYLSKPYGALSGGQKRRLNIALALVGDPEIAFLDEPTTGLDPESRFQFWNYIRRLNARGMTVVVTTHYMEEAHEYCDIVMLMNEGSMAVCGPPDRVITESGLAARVVLPRSVLRTVDDGDITALPSVAYVRVTETDQHLYGNEDLVADIAEYLRVRGVSPGLMQTRPANLNDVYFLNVGSEYPERG